MLTELETEEEMTNLIYRPVLQSWNESVIGNMGPKSKAGRL